jgi:hypothetical protein
VIDAATVATLAFQWLGAALNFLIGVVALRIGAGESRTRPIHLAGWTVVGTALLIAGAVDVFQTSTAVLAVALGPGSFVYDQYVRWAMAMNHSRTGAEIAMGLVLAWLAVRGSPSARGPAAAPWIIVAGLALGAVGGVRTDGFLLLDFLAIAASNTLELAVLGVALLLALIRSSIDWILWVAVAIKMLSQAMNVLIFTTLAWFSADGGWYVVPWVQQLYQLVIVAAMLGLAIWRLRIGSRGGAVAAPLDPLAVRTDRSIARPR